MKGLTYTVFDVTSLKLYVDIVLAYQKLVSLKVCFVHGSFWLNLPHLLNYSTGLFIGRGIVLVRQSLFEIVDDFPLNYESDISYQCSKNRR